MYKPHQNQFKAEQTCGYADHKIHDHSSVGYRYIIAVQLGHGSTAAVEKQEVNKVCGKQTDNSGKPSAIQR